MEDANHSQKRILPQNGDDKEQRKRQKSATKSLESPDDRFSGSIEHERKTIKDVYASYAALSALLRRCLQVKSPEAVPEAVKEVAASHIHALAGFAKRAKDGPETSGPGGDAGRFLAMKLLPRYAAAFGHAASIKHAIDTFATLSLEDTSSIECSKTHSSDLSATNGIVKLLQALPEATLHQVEACIYAVATALNSLPDAPKPASQGLWHVAETAIRMAPLEIVDWCFTVITCHEPEQDQQQASKTVAMDRKNHALSDSALELLERSVVTEWWKDLVNSKINDKTMSDPLVRSRLTMSIQRFLELKSGGKVACTISKELQDGLISLKKRVAPEDASPKEASKKNVEEKESQQPLTQSTPQPLPSTNINVNDAALDLEEGELLEEGEVLEAPSKKTANTGDVEQGNALIPDVCFVSTLVRISNFPSQVRERDVWGAISRFGGRIFHPPAGSPLRRNDQYSFLSSFRSMPDAVKCVEALDCQACETIFPFLGGRSSRENLMRTPQTHLLRVQFEPTPTALHLWYSCSEPSNRPRAVLDAVPPHRSAIVRGKGPEGMVLSFTCLPDAQRAARILNEELSERKRTTVATHALMPASGGPSKYLWRGLIRKGRQNTRTEVVCLPIETIGTIFRKPSLSDDSWPSLEPQDWPEELEMHHRTDVGYVCYTLLPALDVAERALFVLLPAPPSTVLEVKAGEGDMMDDQRQRLASLCDSLRQKHRAGVVDLGPLSDKHGITRVAYLVPVTEEACNAFQVRWPFKVEIPLDGLSDGPVNEGACLFVLVAPSLR